MGLLGSKGGAESASTALGLVILLTPSFFLAPTFVGLMVSVHYRTPPGARIWSHLSVVFATIYAAMVGTVYYVQLALVAPRLVLGDTSGIEPFLFIPFDSFLYSVDILGYSFMSLATLFAARAFTGGGLERTARLFLTANGLLIPFIALQTFYHPLIWIAALWAVTFPGATLSLAILFRKAEDSELA